MKEALINVISEKLYNYIITENKIQEFINNPNIEELIKNYNLETVLTHGFELTKEDNIEISNRILQQINKQLENSESEKTQDLPKEKVLTEKKVAGFVDALIVAFITGSFIGIVLLNIYSKIVQNI